MSIRLIYGRRRPDAPPTHRAIARTGCARVRQGPIGTVGHPLLSRGATDDLYVVGSDEGRPDAASAAAYHRPSCYIENMLEVSFESTRTVGQEEFEAWATERLGWDPNDYELLNGRIVMTPPAGYPHGSVGSRVQFALTSFVRQHGLGEVLDSSQGFAFPSGDSVEPDHAFVSRERWEAMPVPE